MDYKSLLALADQNDVRIDHDDFSRTPPYYFDSLRHAFGFYFNTFNTMNSSYDFYAEGLSGNISRSNNREFHDEENTVLAIVAFERFFELYIKNLLSKVDVNLTYPRNGKNISVRALLSEILTGSFVPAAINGKPLKIPFRETLKRFFGIAGIKSDDTMDDVVKRFQGTLDGHAFLNYPDHHASLNLLNVYRDNILHNGDKLPSMWMLDYFVTQRLVPIIWEILKNEEGKLGDSLFYFTTYTSLDILERLKAIKYEFEDLNLPEKRHEIFEKLLYIGHLKELGRANLNMDLLTRRNLQARYEYNYRDPRGRGRRFAIAEQNGYEHATRIAHCVCCGENSMVVYNEIIEDIFNPGSKKTIEWVKCYTCDYHLRHNAGDPNYFRLSNNEIFK